MTYQSCMGNTYTFLSNKISIHYTLMNAGTYSERPHENTMSMWLLPCTCGS